MANNPRNSEIDVTVALILNNAVRRSNSMTNSPIISAKNRYQFGCDKLREWKDNELSNYSSRDGIEQWLMITGRRADLFLLMLGVPGGSQATREKS